MGLLHYRHIFYHIVHPKGDQSWVFMEGLMLRLKLQYFGHLMRRVDHWKRPWCWERDWGKEEKGTTEDEMAGWHHQLDAHETEWTLGVGDGQGGLACYSSWGCKESNTTELNWNHQGSPILRLMRYIPMILSHICVWLGYCQLGEASRNRWPHPYSQLHDTTGRSRD